jgi:hypothetical protein
VAELGEDRFVTAVDRGRDMPLDELLEELVGNESESVPSAR